MPYSQGSEEEAIRQAARAAGLNERHTVLDIGAGDGQTFSNSRALIEAGMGAILIEADYEAFGKLVELYPPGCKKRITLINGAVGLDCTIQPFTKSVDGGLYSSLTPDKRFAEKAKLGYYVPVFTPAMYKAAFAGTPQVISIDIEGMSFDVLKAFGDDWVKESRVLCIEHDGRAIEIAEWAKPMGFVTKYLDQQNIVVAR